MRIEKPDYRVEVVYDVCRYGTGLDEVIVEVARKFRGVVGGAYSDVRTRDVGVYFLTKMDAINGYRGLVVWAKKCPGVSVTNELIEYDSIGGTLVKIPVEEVANVC